MSQMKISPREAAILGYLHDSRGKGMVASKLMRSMDESSRNLAGFAIAGRLSDLEREFLTLLGGGAQVAEMGRALQITTKDILQVKESLMNKLNLSNSDELTRVARSVAQPLNRRVVDAKS